ncbi:MAG: BCD family MFS transporter [Chloroflexi bacterium]|nr:BCD family MFS transporter [Chloroflexota bacterium]
MSRFLTKLNVARLALFPLGLGLALVLVTGTLNRVMIVELKLPASLVGLFFAMTLVVAPARAWLGYLSDGYPLFGKRREPYIALGAVLLSLSVIAVTLLVMETEVPRAVLVPAGLLAFISYALGVNLSSNTFEALLADRFHGDARPRAVTLFKIAMFAGIMIGALGLGRLLEPFDPERFITIVVGVLALFITLAVIGTARQEPALPALRAVSKQAVAQPFWVVIRRVIWQDRDARRFFVLVVLSTLGTLAQDVLLEPYGALVLDMSVAQTTRLTALWSSGTMITLVVSGVWLIKRWGYMAALRAGLAISVAVFGGIVAAGWLGSVPLFMALVFTLGLGAGLAMAGLLTAVIEFTTTMRAGLLMGVWGMASEFGQSAGGFLGGVVVDILRALTGGNNWIAYGAVFTLEAILLVIVLALAGNLHVERSAVQKEARSQTRPPTDEIAAAGL